MTPDDSFESLPSADDTSRISIGATIGHYRIVEKLGQGGMGEVYRAEDNHLKRSVALKVLPADLAGDSQRLERFQREAEVIAALNHPNIVTIYSVERDREIRFLTMELVDGESLDRTIAAGPLPLTQVLEIGATLADALAVAHDKGIVHRDVKPANVMLSRHGDVKMLDFGLAKVARGADETEDVTQLATLTQEGVAVGTAAYMSPEQAQGLPVDTRSDLFSLGCLLYEAATGRRPFQGESTIDLLHNLIHGDAEPLVDHLPDAPQQLQWIIRKSLAKNPRERYQSAADLAIDLRSLEKDLETDPSLATLEAATATAAEPPPSGSRWGHRIVMTIVLVLLAGAILVWRAVRPGDQEPRTASSAPPLSIEKLTSEGNVIAAAISPDGNFFTYVRTLDAGGQNLNLQQIAGGRELELVPFRPVGYWSLGFSPAGSEILYGLKSEPDPAGRFFRISTLGGLSEKLGGEGIDSLADLSPDGTRLTWYRAHFPDLEQSSLIVANADGTEPRILVSVTQPDRFAPEFFNGPGWSPDGKLIATGVVTSGIGSGSRIEIYDAGTGELEWSLARDWTYIGEITWLPEGDSFLTVGGRFDQRNAQIWQISYPEGSARRVTNDFLRYRMISLSADGRRLLTVGADTSNSIWTASTDGSRPPRRISKGRQDCLFGLAIAPDGRVVFPTLRSGLLRLAIMNPDGTDTRILTGGDTDDSWPRMTPGGDIVYVASTTETSELRRMALEDGEPTVLATGRSRMRPAISPDGRWVIYQDSSLGTSHLWRVPATGGTPERLTDYEANRSSVSPDSSRIAFYFRETPDSGWQIGIAPITGGPPKLVFDQPFIFANSFILWSEDGDALLVNSAAEDRANLWRLPLDGGDPERLTNFNEPRLSWVEFHPDGETMIFCRNLWSRDAILIENFR